MSVHESAPQELEDLSGAFANNLSLAVWKECPESFNCGFSDLYLYIGEQETLDEQIEQDNLVALECGAAECPYSNSAKWVEVQVRIAELTVAEYFEDENETDFRIEIA